MNYSKGIGALPIIIILGVIIIGGIFLIGKDAEAPAQNTLEENENTGTTTEQTMEEENNNSSEENTPTQEVIVRYTSEGFTPQKIEVPVGTTVTFVNESSNKMWVATNVHPSHTVYPDSDINKCGTEEASTIFDQCESTENGGSYSFTFNKVGEWDYHNHSRSKDGGTVVVK